MHVTGWPTWCRLVRVCANGRIEVSCRCCQEQFWLTIAEAAWAVCPHCVGWWTFDPLTAGGLTAPSPTEEVSHAHRDASARAQ